MGIKDGPRFFNYNLKFNSDVTEQTLGKKAAFEAYGFLYELLISHMQHTDARATALSCHLWGGHKIDSELYTFMVEAFVSEMKWFRDLFHAGFVVVFEGPPYQAKAGITSSRRAKHKAAFEASQHRQALSIPDCLVKIIIRALEQERIRFIVPPAEADSQLAWLSVIPCAIDISMHIYFLNGIIKCLHSQKNGVVDFILVPSNDSDLCVYPGVTNIIYKVEHRKDSNQLRGVLVERA